MKFELKEASQQAFKFPIIALIARDILPIPGASVSVERSSQSQVTFVISSLKA